MKLLILCALIALACGQHILSADDGTAITEAASPTYIAAVVEFATAESEDGQKNVAANLKRHVDIIMSAETKDAQIILFPENVLNDPKEPAVVPKVEDKAVPCNNDKYTEVIRNISCAAKDAQKYVVVQVYMQRDCKEEAAANKNDTRPCPKEHNIYNTAVAFDRTGQVVAVYRKFNLYNEDHLVHRTLLPDVAIFDTDFGVKFGVMICFDLVFSSPMQQLIDQGVTNFILPSMWYSELPFATSLQMQQSVAYSHNINLLAAGASNPKQGSSGSGIYSGRFGALKALIVNTPTTKVLLSKVPKVPGVPIAIASPQQSPQMRAEALTQPTVLKLNNEDLSKYTFQWLNFNENVTQIGRLCNNKVCCNYNIKVDVAAGPAPNTPFYSYAVTAFEGTREMVNPHTKTGVAAGFQSCALIACTQYNDANTCGKRISDIHAPEYERYTFVRLELIGHMADRPTLNIMPNTVSTAFLPLNSVQLNFTEKDYQDAEGRQMKNVIFDLLYPKSDILTFAVYARDYEQDKIFVVSAATSVTVGFVILSSVVVTLFW